MEYQKEKQSSEEMQQNCDKLRLLERTHQQLQSSLYSKKQQLIIHSKMLIETHPDSQFSKLSQQLIHDLFDKEDSIKNAYANMLINGQIRLEQQIQLRDILTQYQLRMMELRTTMIDKEIQLTAEMGTKTKDTAPTIQHLRLFHIGLMEEQNIKKILKDHQALTTQVMAMEDQLKARSHRRRDTTCQDNNKNHFKKPILSNNQKYINSNVIYVDRLIDRVYTLLKQQIEQEKKLNQQYQQLKSTYRQISDKHRKITTQYKKSQKIDENHTENNVLNNKTNTLKGFNQQISIKDDKKRRYKKILAKQNIQSQYDKQN